MNLTELLFSFKGRIRRLHWWIAALAVGVVSGVLTSILELAAKASGSAIVDPETYAIEPTGLFGIALLAVGLANTWITFALCVKRLHDRDRTGWWLVWQSLVLILAVIVTVVAIALPKEQAPAWYVIAGIAGIVALGISIWLFVEIGFLRGTQGPNRFGPDPLGGTRADINL
jgi:uncharacterized membrane protein YhaH (DUF805 family)